MLGLGFGSNNEADTGSMLLWGGGSEKRGEQPRSTAEQDFGVDMSGGWL